MQKKIILWLSVAILALIAIIWATAPSGTQSMTDKDQALWPGALDHIQKAQFMILSTAQDRVLLQKTAEGWVVPAKYNYPADQKQLRALFSALADGKYLQRKTAKSDNHSVLHLGGTELSERKSVVLTISEKKDQADFEMILGKEGPMVAGARTQYARLPAQDQVWLISELPVAQTSAQDWMSDKFIKILNGDIERIQFSAEGQTDFLIDKASVEDRDFILANIPAGWEVKSSYDVNQAAYLLEYVDYTDIRPMTDQPQNYFTIGTTGFQSFDGLDIQITWSEDLKDGLWAAFNLQLRQDMTLTEDQKKAAQAVIDQYQPLLSAWRYQMPERHRDVYLSGIGGFLTEISVEKVE